MKKIRFVKTARNTFYIQTKTLFGWCAFRLIDAIESLDTPTASLQLFDSKKEGLKKYKKAKGMSKNDCIKIFPTIKVK